jgi:iron(III) transport system ATP-binding protein
MVKVESLRKAFQSGESRVDALAGVSFEVGKGSFFTLLGPSGCGKTTTLRSIAGLERPDVGKILIGERVVFSSEGRVFVPGNRRDIGMVFQSYAIWPHMTVMENIAFPLSVRKVPSKTIRRRVLEVVALVGLSGLEDRGATDLSGGQQQRVALARALVAEPQVLLLDEPLSNLDAKLRSQMRWELKDLQNRLGTTTLYVTHDQVEALAISDEIALMNRGKVVQIGTPREIYSNPVNQFAADFIGAANILPGQLMGEPGADGRALVRTPLGDLLATRRSATPLDGDSVLVAFRPESVLISAGARTEAHNVFSGEVEGFTYLGESTEFHVMLGGQRIQAKGDPGLSLERGSRVHFHIPADHCLLIRGGET